MAALKYSRQRESIKEFLLMRNDHPTADTVYNNIRCIYPNISLGTVYRNLSLLASIGEINKISTGDGPDHFDGTVRPHNHFVCRSCHRVMDLDMEDIGYIQEVAGKNFSGTIDSHITNFYGICEDCMVESTSD